jgi:hypothetical protein
VSDAIDRLPSAGELEDPDDVLGRSQAFDWGHLEDETIDRVADGAFLEYDLNEDSDHKSEHKPKTWAPFGLVHNY